MADFDIGNEALILLGERPSLASLGDGTNAANALNTVYDSTRKRLLRSAIWSFAVERGEVLSSIDPYTTAWADTPTSYDAGDLVLGSDSVVYVSRVNGNEGNDPAGGLDTTNWRAITPYGSAAWDSTVTYATGQVAVLNGDVYASILAGSGQVPDQAPTYWVDTTLDIITPAFNFTYQLVMPTNWLRWAPSTKDEADLYKAVQREGNVFRTNEGLPFNARWVQDVTDTDTFDPLFYQAFAATLAMITCERITQSNAKKADAKDTFDRAITEARRVNAIERGPMEDRVDDWIQVRQPGGQIGPYSPRSF